MSARADRIKVLVLIKGLGIGGAETLIAESAAHWDRDHFEHRVVFMLPWKDQLVGRLESAGVTVDPLDWHRPPGLGAMVRLRRLVRSWDPDIVHSHLPSAGLLARAALPGRAHVYTEHNVVSSYRPMTRLLNRMTYSRNRAVIAVSEAVATSLAGYPGPAVRVIPNGVAIDVAAEDVAAARGELGLDATDPLVVHVGNIRPHKGHTTLIQAAGVLLQQVPEVTVVSIGGEKYDGDLERVRQLAAQQGLGDRVRFLGRREDARAFIAAADVVVNPADVEGLPVSLLEALALARPVVATAVGGVPSVVRNEETGLLVSPGDSGGMAAAIRRALQSPEARGWGRRGAQLIQSDFGLQRMVDAYQSVYREVAGV